METAVGDVIFRSKLPDIYIPKHLPLHSYIFENISKYRTKPCLINGATDEVYTYEQVELLSRKVAAGLSRLGLRRGDTVMLLLPNSPDFVLAFLGASYIGAISTFTNPYFAPAEVVRQARVSNAKLIITEASYVEKVRDYAADQAVKVVCLDSDSPPPMECLSFSDLTSSDEREIPEVEVRPDEVVAVPHSSGTTGLPKGVMLTHKALVTSVGQQVDGENPNMYIHSDDVMLCALPLFHIYGLQTVLLCGLRVGAAIVIMHKFDIVPSMELIQRYKVTIAQLVPPIVLAIVKNPVVDNYDASSVRLVMSGAAPLGKDLEEAVKDKFPNAKLGQAYGMTEAGPVMSMCLAFAKEPFEIKSGACGTVVRNAEMKIVDTQTGASLGRNKPGEMCIRGDQIMKGYLNDQELTERAIDKQGWLHTGDIGFFDDDDELFIVDRFKEIIKYKEYLVAPAEIEALLVNNPCVFDAAVVAMKDEEAGEVPVAFVVRSNGSKITEDEIKEFVSQQVVFYKRINRVFFVDAIPKNPSGKILRKDLRAKLAAPLSN